MSKMKCVIVEPMKKPRVIELENCLSSLQNAVGGLIDVTYPFEDCVGIICNDDGIALRLPLNRYIMPHMIIFGTFLIAGLSEDDFRSLTDEQIKKYTEMFKYPEFFVKNEHGDILRYRLGKDEAPVPIDL